MKKFWKVLVECCISSEDLELEFNTTAEVDTDSVIEFAVRKSSDRSELDAKVRISANGCARDHASEEREESRVEKMEEERDEPKTPPKQEIELILDELFDLVAKRVTEDKPPQVEPVTSNKQPVENKFPAKS